MSNDYLQVDIEITNRCNAYCSFCPRDATPHQGLMDRATFERTLARVVEFRDLARRTIQPDLDLKVAICGLGEPLLHPDVADFVRQVRAEGFFCSISSNGALLTETKGRALLEAGLQRIDLNVGELEDRYEEVYRLKWDKTRDRIVRFNEMAGDRCEVRIVIVNHEGGKLKHSMRVGAYWRRQGVKSHFTFNTDAITNRGGTLTFDFIKFDDPRHRAIARETLASAGRHPMCVVPFLSLFVGYDGQYYLCCSDWTKETPMGTVFERSFVDVIGPKLEYVLGREPVCSKCNFEPMNHVADLTHKVETGTMTAEARAEIVQRLVASDVLIRQMATAFGIEVPDVPAAEEERRPAPRRLQVL